MDTLFDTLSEVIAKTIAHTLTCVEAEAQVKTENSTVAGVENYTVVDTVNKVENKALDYTRRLTCFNKCRPRVFIETLRRSHPSMSRKRFRP